MVVVAVVWKPIHLVMLLGSFQGGQYFHIYKGIILLWSLNIVALLIYETKLFLGVQNSTGDGKAMVTNFHYQNFWGKYEKVSKFIETNCPKVQIRWV